MKGDRSRVRRVVLIAGAVLLGALTLAPILPPAYVLPLTVLWYGALGALAWAAMRILRPWVGKRAGFAILALAALLPILLTAIPFSPALAVRLPCPRNWLWLPSWLLRSSPMGSLRFEVNGTRAKLCYGRPALRGRRMLGGSRVPFGKLWRTGANEPTTLISPTPLEIAGVRVPAGRTALYTIPGPESWELILNGSTRQWGIETEYTAEVRAHELGRAILPSQRGDSVERLTFSALPVQGDSTGLELLLAWETARLRIAVQRPSH